MALLGGILGNLLDRIIRGYVTDYVSLNIVGYHFPIFNLADVCITLGVILLSIHYFKTDYKRLNVFLFCHKYDIMFFS